MKQKQQLNIFKTCQVRDEIANREFLTANPNQLNKFLINCKCDLNNL